MSGWPKLDANLAHQIRALLASGMKRRQVAEIFHVHVQSIGNIDRSRTWPESSEVSMERAIEIFGVKPDLVERPYKAKTPIIRRRCLCCDRPFRARHKTKDHICPSCETENQNTETDLGPILPPIPDEL